MNRLSHIVEPQRLLLTWQPADEQAATRTRRIVGEVFKQADGSMAFRYLKDSLDYQAAVAAGFQGFPAFQIADKEFNKGVIESFLRRLPPRGREDFDEYLAQHRLPAPFPYSDFALLGYTGARLPSDGFSLIPVFPSDAVPCDYLLEVAGVRHVIGTDISAINVGDPISFTVDSQNPVDQDALSVVHNGRSIGYVNRALRSTFHDWLKGHRVHASVERQNGKPDRPLIFVRVSVE